METNLTSHLAYLEIHSENMNIPNLNKKIKKKRNVFQPLLTQTSEISFELLKKFEHIPSILGIKRGEKENNSEFRSGTKFVAQQTNTCNLHKTNCIYLHKDVLKP